MGVNGDSEDVWYLDVGSVMHVLNNEAVYLVELREQLCFFTGLLDDVTH